MKTCEKRRKSVFSFNAIMSTLLYVEKLLKISHDILKTSNQVAYKFQWRKSFFGDKSRFFNKVVPLTRSLQHVGLDRNTIYVKCYTAILLWYEEATIFFHNSCFVPGKTRQLERNSRTRYTITLIIPESSELLKFLIEISL